MKDRPESTLDYEDLMPPEQILGVPVAGPPDERPKDDVPLSEVCPEVNAGVPASSLAPFLPPDWDEGMTPGKLKRIRSLLLPEPAAEGPQPDESAVAGIVERMRDAEVRQKRTLWQRFKDWLGRLLERRAQDAGEGWFANWLNEHLPSQNTVKWATRVLLVLLFAAVVWIVYAELKAAGLLERGRAARRPVGAGASAPVRGPRTPSLADASEAELPAVLIALLLRELRRLGRVQDRLSMTHRELVGAARFEAATDAATFNDLVSASERLRYAAVAPAGSTLQRIVAAGRELLASLSRAGRSAA